MPWDHIGESPGSRGWGWGGASKRILRASGSIHAGTHGQRRPRLQMLLLQVRTRTAIPQRSSQKRAALPGPSIYQVKRILGEKRPGQAGAAAH